MGREVLLNGEQNVVVITREEVVIPTNRISIDSVTDDGQKVYAKVSFFSSTGIVRVITLWEGDDYVNIGQWTDNDVNNRVKELLNVI